MLPVALFYSLLEIFPYPDIVPCVPELWTLVKRDRDGVIVSRQLGPRETIWSLEDRGKGWRVYGIYFSQPNAGTNLTSERYKRYSGQCEPARCNGGNAHKNGIRLSD